MKEKENPNEINSDEVLSANDEFIDKDALGGKTEKESEATNSEKTEEKTEAQKEKAKEKESEDKPVKKKIYTQTWFIITLSAVAVLTLIAIMLITAISGGLSLKTLFGGKNEKTRIDYLNDPLGEYIEIKDSDYKGYTVNVPIIKPTETELENEINKLLASKRGEAANLNTMEKTAEIAVGDDIRFSYIGYIPDEAGRKILIKDGENNVIGNIREANESTKKSTVGLNSTLFGIGFDKALVGKKPNGKIDTVYGAVGNEGGNRINDVIIYATSSFVLDNGLAYDEVEICMDPTDPDFEKQWGVGFHDWLNEIKNNDWTWGYNAITLRGDDYKDFELEGGGSIAYTAFTVNYTVKTSVEPITVESRFESTYSIESLRNENVCFDLYVNGVYKYDTPKFDENFVTETLGFTAEELASEEGDNLVDKCKSYYMSRLMSSYNAQCRSYVETAVWNRILNTVKVKLYPLDEINLMFEPIMRSYTEGYAAAKDSGATYDDIGTYIIDVEGLEEGDDWEIYITEQLKADVKERLIIYSILRRENLVPSAEEFEQLYEQTLRDDYETVSLKYPGEFESFEDYRDYIENDYGKEEYKHSVYWYYTVEKLIGFANIVY